MSQPRNYQDRGGLSTRDPKAYRGVYAADKRAKFAAYQKVYRQANRQRIRARVKQWYKDNPKEWNAHNKKYRDKNPDRVYAWYLKSKYRLTKEQLLALGTKCHICGVELQRGTKNKPCIDHDHVTGVVRGLLCGACNHGLGHFRDSPRLLMCAIAYLAKQSVGDVA